MGGVAEKTPLQATTASQLPSALGWRWRWRA